MLYHYDIAKQQIKMILTYPEIINGEQGWRSGESARLPPLWPGFDSRTWRHMWVEFVVGSRPCSKGFSPGSPVFLPPQKPTHQIPIQSGNSGRIATSWKCHC